MSNIPYPKLKAWLKLADEETLEELTLFGGLDQNPFDENPYKSAFNMGAQNTIHKLLELLNKKITEEIVKTSNRRTAFYERHNRNNG